MDTKNYYRYDHDDEIHLHLLLEVINFYAIGTLFQQLNDIDSKPLFLE